ncbi:MAG: DoxX family protein [Bacteroidales bacterium]|jgi:putative oxidoreductase|nr:DoxX family protein [Bacteroidales bacterium]MCK9449938.1 DoxX family protein [Bacteroidales bacterium]MDY0369532.1 DoxX family protein [Bacteroidales bacterium]
MNIISFLTKEFRTGNDIGLFLLRLVASMVLLYGHGFEKLMLAFSGQEIHFMNPIGIGATTSFYLSTFAESICAILLAIGLFSRFATLVLTINFIVIFIFHAFIVGDGFSILELRFFYLSSFIALTLLGPGKLSLDYIFFYQKR